MVESRAMQMEAIKLFCDVAQWRSVSRAARAHGVTQSAASQRIQALEREVGVKLIDRSTRPLRLTEAGETYYEGCREILRSYVRLTSRIAERPVPSRDMEGEISIAAIYSAGIGLLSHIRRAFERECPKVKVGLTYLHPERVYEQVLQGRCDAGILSYPNNWEGLSSLWMRDEEMVVVVRSYPPPWDAPDVLRGRELRETLKSSEMAAFVPSLPIEQRIRHYLREQGVTPTVAGEFDNIDTIKTYVSQTDAWSMLPLRAVQDEVEGGALRAIHTRPALLRPVGLVWRKDKHPNRLVMAFMDSVMDQEMLLQESIPSGASY